MGTRFNEKDLRKGVRTSPWVKNEKSLPLDQVVIEETVLNLKLNKCPVCKDKLKSGDRAGNMPKSTVQPVQDEKYCHKDKIAVRLSTHPYVDGTRGTQIFMDIYTDSRNSKHIAESGVLADLIGNHDLHR
ncbi:hypothetical protein ACFLZJ_01440 [Nanoarchaeota archaeon]